MEIAVKEMRRGNEIQKICVTECEALRLGIHLHYLYIVRSMMFTLAWLCTFIYLEGRELARLRGLPRRWRRHGHGAEGTRRSSVADPLQYSSIVDASEKAVPFGGGGVAA